MAFKELTDLDCNITSAIGGVDKKTGKKNPVEIEGFYLGSRQVPSPKSKTGFAWLHVLLTPKGNYGIWGKTDLDRKMPDVPPGTMTRIKFTGMQQTKNNPMYKYSVAVDTSNTIEVNLPESAPAEAAADESPAEDDTAYASTGDGYEPEADVDEDEAPAVEVARPAARKPIAAAPSAAQQSRVQGLLGRK